MSYTQNRKLGYLGKPSLISNFGSYCNLILGNDKSELRQSFCPFSKIEKLRILKRFLSLQIFTVVLIVPNLHILERGWSLVFFVTFNIKSRFSWKLYWSSSSCSEDMEIFSFNVNISIFRIFRHFLVKNKLMTSSYSRWCSHFFTFNLPWISYFEQLKEILKNIQMNE